MQASTYHDFETEEKRVRLELFHAGPAEQERLQKRMEQRAEQLRRQGEEIIATVHLRKKKTDPKRFRRARRSR